MIFQLFLYIPSRWVQMSWCVAVCMDRKAWGGVYKIEYILG